jgi:predicted RND superfamily exporter protein
VRSLRVRGRLPTPFASGRVVGLVDRHRWAVIAAFLVACAAGAYVHAARARYDLTYRTMAPRNTAEAASFERFVSIFGRANDVFVIGFSADPLLTAGNLRMIERITARLEALEGTHSVTSLTNALDIVGREGTLDVVEFVGSAPASEGERAALKERLTTDPVLAGGLISRQGSTTAIVVRIDESKADHAVWSKYFDEVARILSQEGGGQVDFHLAGYPYLSNVLMGYMIDDTGRFIPLTVALMCGFLWLSFGRLRAAWMPLVPVVVAGTLTMGALSASGLPMSLLTGQGVLSTLIMVIGISDGVHILSRYEEEAASDRASDSPSVLARTLRQVGLACFLTSLTTAIGLISLAVADVPSVRDFGVFGAVGVGIAFLGAVVLLPALILAVERGRRPPPRRTTTARWLDHGLAFLAEFVPLHRHAIIVVSCLVLLASLAAIPWARIDGRPVLDLKVADPARRSLEYLDRNLGGAYPLEIVIDGGRPDAIKEPALLAAVDHVESRLQGITDVSRVTSPVDFIKKMNRAMEENRVDGYRLPDTRNAVAQYLLLFEMEGSDAEFERLVNYDYSVARMTAVTTDITSERYGRLLEEFALLKSGRMPPGTDLQISGEGPLWHSATHTVIATLIGSLYIAMPLVFLVIALTFRSVRLGAISILPNVIPLTLALGVLAPFDIALRFSTITAFPLAFGLAVDDTIHFLARYRHELAAGCTVEEAVRKTMLTTGRPMVLTSALLVAGFSVLFVSNFLGIVHVTLLMCLILIVALLGDLVLLPALILTIPPAAPTAETPSSSAPTV